MELALICLAVAFMVTGKHQKDTAQAAYKAGKEPPGLQKARMRHEKGGGRFKPARGGGQQPAGPGAARRTIATRWGHACEKARDRMEDKHQRWRAWYAEQAPQRDESWREKQQRRLDKRGQRLERFQCGWTRTKDSLNPSARACEDAAWNENTARSPYDCLTPAEAAAREAARQEAAGQEADAQEAASALKAPVQSGTQGSTPVPDGEQPQTGSESAPAEQPATTVLNSQNTNQTGGQTVYADAADRLHAAAEQIEQYRADLAAMGDGLEAKGWGVEVHGPVSDMDQHLADVAGGYRDLAGQMQTQGDSVNDAHDAHPYVPGGDAVLA